MCRRCGCGWIDPGVRPEPPTDYEDEYFEFYRGKDSFQGGVRELPEHLHERLLELETEIGRPGRLLEIGCGFGTFLAAARDRGWEVFGTDVSTWAARHIQAHVGIEIERGDIMSVPLPPGLDVIHMNHTLEHLADPLGALRRLRTALAPDGLLVIEVPNELFCLVERARWIVLRRFTPPLGENPHLFFFTAAALSALLLRAGYTPTSVATHRRNCDFDSRLPAGGLVKRGLYWIERTTLRGPNVVARARPTRGAQPRGAA